MSMVIRDEQLNELTRVTRPAYVGRVLVFLERRHPARMAEVGREEARLRIETALNAAPDWGLVEGEDLTRYCELTFLFGVGFEHDSAYPWAAEIAHSGWSSPSELVTSWHVTGLALLDL
ncbi:hypothetical protein F0U61_29885 [Archangium violaceum]|uniref:hypothetical protein n=1 Tax=Archangium violaceum TaxID=83451 RepID=UPI002B304D4D|nr:hypothetical protein F0U61_29885 [Archangium violaceum]